MARRKLGGTNDRNNSQEDQEAMLTRVYELTIQSPKLSKKQIADSINRSEKMVYIYWQKLIALPENDIRKLTIGKTGRPERPQAAIIQQQFEELNATDFVSQNPTVQNWIAKGKRGGKKGNGVGNMSIMVTQLYVICRTLKIRPDAFLISPSQTAELMEQFKEKFLKGETEYISKIQKQQSGKHKIMKSGIETSMRHYAVAVANYCWRNDKQLPKGMDGAMSRKKENFGAYSMVKLTDKEVLGGIEFLKNHPEGGEDWAALFALHHEMITRTETMVTWKVDVRFKEIPIDGVICKYAECPQVYESKTHKAFDKIIINPVALEYARKLKQGQTIIPNQTSSDKTISKYNHLLRQYYASIGRIDPEAITNHSYYKKVVDGERYYLAYNPNYTLRHSGCHLWSRRCDYNPVYVMSLGWEDPSMITQVYGKMPNEQRLKGNICNYCRPSEGQQSENMDDQFCSWNHALVYYNNGKISQKEMFAEREMSKKINIPLTETQKLNIPQIEVPTPELREIEQ